MTSTSPLSRSTEVTVSPSAISVEMVGVEMESVEIGKVDVAIAQRVALACAPAVVALLGGIGCWCAMQAGWVEIDLITVLAIGFGCALASVIGQLPIALAKQFDIQKIAGQLMVSLTVRSCLTVLALLGIVRGGIADWQGTLVPFVAWYATLLLVDLSVAIRFITRLAPSPPDRQVFGAGEQRS